MKSSPRRIIVAIADALFEDNPRERGELLAEEVLAFVSAAALTTRTTLGLALWLLRWSPLFMLMSWRPLERLASERRREVLERVERSPFALAFVPWRMLLLMHFYEDARELASIGYRDERKRHLAIIPVPATSGVRLRDDAGDLRDLHDHRDSGEIETEKGAA
jgi:hypothetical protein